MSNEAGNVPTENTKRETQYMEQDNGTRKATKPNGHRKRKLQTGNMNKHMGKAIDNGMFVGMT